MTLHTLLTIGIWWFDVSVVVGVIVGSALRFPHFQEEDR